MIFNNAHLKIQKSFLVIIITHKTLGHYIIWLWIGIFLYIHTFNDFFSFHIPHNACTSLIWNVRWQETKDEIRIYVKYVSTELPYSTFYFLFMSIPVMCFLTMEKQKSAWIGCVSFDEAFEETRSFYLYILNQNLHSIYCIVHKI